MKRWRVGRGTLSVVVGTVCVVLAPGPVTAVRASAADTPVDPRAQREQVRQQKSDAAKRLDVLRASDGEIRKALQDLADNVASVSDDLTSARRDVAASESAVTGALADEASKQADVDGSVHALQTLSLAAYTGTPTVTPLDVIVSDSNADEAFRYGLAQVQAFRLSSAVDKLQAEKADLKALRFNTQKATALAKMRSDEVAAKLAALQVARDDEAALATSLADRIDQTLAEAASLAGLDKSLSDQIARQEAELLARLKAAQLKAAKEKAAADAAAKADAAKAKAAKDAAAKAGSRLSPTSTTKPAKGGVIAPIPSSTTDPSTTDPSTTASSTTRPAVVDPSTMVWVRGILVAPVIAEPVGRLMDAAMAGGLHLDGSGFRDAAAQIEIRRQTCGPTDYDIYEKPSFMCNPPVARPGHSMHEKGLAIDFTCDGAVVRAGDKCFAWLKDHAAAFGLYNLDSEPWHWSTNGS